MGKLADILKQDVGSMATKVFHADVGLMVKSAGRALNTDVGTIAKGAGQILSYDLADLFVNEGKDPGAKTSTNGDDGIEEHSQPQASTSAEPVTNNYQPESTNTTARVKLTAALVHRNSRAMPESSDLIVLLPTTVGSFSRSASALQGEIASDPVSAIYSSDTEAITITMTVYWDADEASAQMQRRQSTLENMRSSTDHTWVAGTDNLGVIFVWTRQHVCYEIVSPRGVSPLARFLADFPH